METCPAPDPNAPQFSVGRSRRSITSTSRSAREASSRSPSCSRTAVNTDSAFSGGATAPSATLASSKRQVDPICPAQPGLVHDEAAGWPAQHLREHTECHLALDAVERADDRARCRLVRIELRRWRSGRGHAACRRQRLAVQVRRHEAWPEPGVLPVEQQIVGREFATLGVHEQLKAIGEHRSQHGRPLLRCRGGQRRRGADVIEISRRPVGQSEDFGSADWCVCAGDEAAGEHADGRQPAVRTLREDVRGARRPRLRRTQLDGHDVCTSARGLAFGRPGRSGATRRRRPFPTQRACRPRSMARPILRPRQRSSTTSRSGTPSSGGP